MDAPVLGWRQPPWWRPTQSLTTGVPAVKKPFSVGFAGDSCRGTGRHPDEEQHVDFLYRHRRGALTTSWRSGRLRRLDHRRRRGAIYTGTTAPIDH